MSVHISANHIFNYGSHINKVLKERYILFFKYAYTGRPFVLFFEKNVFKKVIEQPFTLQQIPV